MRYIPVIGLEIHCELSTDSKVFCSCSNAFGGSENTRVCPRCSGMPGTLPLLNQNAVTLAAKAGFVLDCTVNNYSAFDRKNYFYPDLPKAYQITQFMFPICTGGYIEISGRKLRIHHIHIEEDAGKLIHDDGEGISMADYNRCGVPLIEIVTEPDFRTIKEVQRFVEQIALRLKYAGVCDARMEQGSMRVDVNISIMPEDSTVFGTRAEIKNLNSVKAIGRAIEYEIKRQAEILDNGGQVVQETRRFNDDHGDTKVLRSKEEAHDYRYFPEPDIPPILLSDEEIAAIRQSMPEMPHKRFARYTGQYGLPEADAELLISTRALSDFYDSAVAVYPAYKQTANLMLVELNRNLNDSGLSVDEIRLTPADLAKIVKMSDDAIISKNSAKELISVLFYESGDPEATAKEKGMILSQDPSTLENIINQVIAENASSIESFKNGNQKIFGFLMGQIVRRAGKGANPMIAKELLMKKLNS